MCAFKSTESVNVKQCFGISGKCPTFAKLFSQISFHGKYPMQHLKVCNRCNTNISLITFHHGFAVIKEFNKINQ